LGEGLSTHALGRGVRGDELGMLLLKAIQFIKEAVIFGIRDFRIVQNIVAMVVKTYQLAKLLNPVQHFLFCLAHLRRPLLLFVTQPAA